MPDVLLSTIQAQVVIAAMELGVFEQFERGPISLSTLADRTETDPDALAVLVRALVALGYLEEGDGTYTLTEPARQSLPAEDADAVGAWFAEYMRQGADAAEAIRNAPVDGLIGWETIQSGEAGRGYQATMRWLASDLVDPVVDNVTLPDKAQRMLDLGGSHGLYTVGFCETHPDLEGTILDWEIGLEAAKRTLSDRPRMRDRIDLIEGDFEKEELPDGYDFAFLGNIVHGLTPGGNRELFEKIARATTEQGTIAILDQIVEESNSLLDRLDPTQTSFTNAVAALVGFNLYLFSGGRTYQYEQVSEWLGDAGFTEVSYQAVRQSPGMSLVTARKPG